MAGRCDDGQIGRASGGHGDARSGLRRCGSCVNGADDVHGTDSRFVDGDTDDLDLVHRAIRHVGGDDHDDNRDDLDLVHRATGHVGGDDGDDIRGDLDHGDDGHILGSSDSRAHIGATAGIGMVGCRRPGR